MSAQNFVDPYKDPSSNMKVGSMWTTKDEDYGVNEVFNPNAFGSKISDFLGISDYKTKYDLAMTKLNQAYERANINSARAWEEWFDSTATQRRVADIKAAGLNPWLALNGGSLSANGSASTSTGGSAKYKSSSDSKSNLSSIAMFLLATAKLFTILM